MKLVGLGGGIGSGKSTVSSMFAERGAVIVDADLVARYVVEPGGPCLDSLVERFGKDILTVDGVLNRANLAAKVFGFPLELAALNSITHPAINDEIRDQIATHEGSDRAVILDAALLFGTRRSQMVGRILVDVDHDVAVNRLITYRGFSEKDARARIASQMSREEQRALADFVIDNSNGLDALRLHVALAWDWIMQLPDSARLSHTDNSSNESTIAP